MSGAVTEEVLESIHGLSSALPWGERAFAQYDQVDPNNRLVADVLEQRWNAKLDDQHRIERELVELQVRACRGSRLFSRIARTHSFMVR